MCHNEVTLRIQMSLNVKISFRTEMRYSSLDHFFLRLTLFKIEGERPHNFEHGLYKSVSIIKNVSFKCFCWFTLLQCKLIFHKPGVVGNICKIVFKLMVYFSIIHMCKWYIILSVPNYSIYIPTITDYVNLLNKCHKFFHFCFSNWHTF